MIKENIFLLNKLKNYELRKKYIIVTSKFSNLKNTKSQEKQENVNNKTKTLKHMWLNPRLPNILGAEILSLNFLPRWLAMNKAWKLHSGVSLINKYWSQAEWRTPELPVEFKMGRL